MSLYDLFTASDLFGSVGEYFGIIETLEVKIDRLTKSELDAGIRSLDQAKNSISSEKKELIRDARRYFNKAITLESGERLASAFLGLAFCHYYFNERKNCKDMLEKIMEMESFDFYNLGHQFIHLFNGEEILRRKINFKMFQKEISDFTASNLGEYPYCEIDSIEFKYRSKEEFVEREKERSQRDFEEGRYVEGVMKSILNLNNLFK